MTRKERYRALAASLRRKLEAEDADYDEHVGRIVSQELVMDPIRLRVEDDALRGESDS